MIPSCDYCSFWNGINCMDEEVWVNSEDGDECCRFHANAIKKPNCKNVLDIITNYLKENGYDGLYYGQECGCELDDLCPCEEVDLNCQPGYKVKALESSEYAFYICPTKDSEPWNGYYTG